MEDEGSLNHEKEWDEWKKRLKTNEGENKNI